MAPFSNRPWRWCQGETVRQGRGYEGLHGALQTVCEALHIFLFVRATSLAPNGWLKLSLYRRQTADPALEQAGKKQ